MKILLTGKDGQIGRELRRTLAPLGELTALGHAELDLENPTALHGILQAHAPHIIVNAAAYTAVDKAESEEARAHRINAEAVNIMATHAGKTGTLLIHYSTDYVFDGMKSAPYVEGDPPAPLNAYGRTKLAGEAFIRQSGCNALVFRTSWVVSSHGHNFIKTILRLANERESLDIVADQHGAPTAASLIADITAVAIPVWRHGALPAGLYHLTASGETSWHSFAAHIIQRAWTHNVALKLRPRHIKPISTEAWPTPAKRPKNSRLDCSALSAALDLPLPNWKIHVDPIIDQLVKLGIPA